MRDPSSLLLNYSLVNKTILDKKISTIFVREKIQPESGPQGISKSP